MTGKKVIFPLFSALEVLFSPWVLSLSSLCSSQICSIIPVTFFGRLLWVSEGGGSEDTRQDWAASASCLIPARSQHMALNIPSREGGLFSYTHVHTVCKIPLTNTKKIKEIKYGEGDTENGDEGRQPKYQSLQVSWNITCSAACSPSQSVFLLDSSTNFLKISKRRSHLSSTSSLSLEMRSLQEKKGCFQNKKALLIPE